MNTEKTTVHLCARCIDELRRHFPYTCNITVKEVPMRKCDNYTVNGKFVNLEKSR